MKSSIRSNNISFENGDLLIFKATAIQWNLFLWVIWLATFSRYNHVAIVVKKPNGLYFLESAIGGSNLIPIEALEEYQGEIWIRKLQHRSKELQFRFSSLISDYDKRDYPGFFELFKRVVLRMQPHQHRTTSFHCAELIATILKKLGLLSPDLKTYSCKPCEFFEDNNSYIEQFWSRPLKIR